MEYDIRELREKVDNYFLGKLPKELLGRWAEKAYYDLLRGGYVEKSKIVLYPFLKIISTLHVESNDLDDRYPCSDEEVREIQKILHGDKDFDFSVEMSIPLQVYSMFSENICLDMEEREIITKIQNEIDCIFQGTGKRDSTIVEYVNSYSRIAERNETLQDILEEHIVKLCRVLLEMNSDGVKKRKGLKLYAQKTNQDCMIEKLNDYLNCYLGKRNFNIIVSFRQGIPEILLLV